jgi:Lon protease-like protein
VGAGSVPDLYEVGCLARLVHATRVGDGRYFVLGTGERRFHLDALAPGAGTAYLMGEVTVLEERLGDTAEVAGLAHRLRGALHDYAHTLGAEEPEWPSGVDELSYVVGGALGLDLGDRQRLLAAADTEARLRLGLLLVHREQRLATMLGVVPPGPEHGFNLN